MKILKIANSAEVIVIYQMTSLFLFNSNLAVRIAVILP